MGVKGDGVMPIIYTDSYKCEKCGKRFEWNYFELKRQNIDSPQFEVEYMPHRKTLAHRFHQIDKDTYLVEVNCPHCDFDNHFSINKE